MTLPSAPQFLLVDDPLFDEHRPRGYHPERPERLGAARESIRQVSGSGSVFSHLAPRDATNDDIALVHDAAYVAVLDGYAGLFGQLDEDTYLGPRSVAAAYRAAGGAIAMVDGILAEEGPRRGVALVRPPGHHARPSTGMGFCLVNNVAVAAAHARRRGVSRVAIVDWDVHHGNGTQEVFWKDPNVLFVSLHQYPFYPGSGGVEDVGEGEGRGFTINVPLSQGATDASYVAAFDRIVVPVLDQFAPELVLVSAGFDAHARDPLAGMSVTARGFAAMAERLGRVAETHAQGRIGALLEGGYDLAGLRESLTASLEAFGGAAAPVEADAGPRSQRHDQDIARAQAALARYWKLG
jgi:acetoin utilization deacetylase AcuC-like enzyme